MSDNNQFDFQAAIRQFNDMYKMRVADVPTLDVGVPVLKRLTDLKVILLKEVEEIEVIRSKVAAFQEGRMFAGMNGEEEPRMVDDLEILTDIADLMGDLPVYCASEMTKFGIPLMGVLEIIMQSNFSKMGADGKPIYDENDKLQKGPNYWKPEPKIRELLQQLIADAAAKTVAQAPAAADLEVAAQGETAAPADKDVDKS